MPSRRRFLAVAAGLGTATSLSGCLTDLGLAETGYLQVKGVSVTWHHERRRFRDEVLLATSDGRSELQVRVAEAYEGIVGAPRDVRVTEALERRIERDFAAATYVVGFCWDGPRGHTCRNSRTSRDAFNRVQFGDRAEVVFDSPGVDVVDVYERAQGDPARWETEFRTFDFAERHDGEGVPIGGGSGA